MFTNHQRLGRAKEWVPLGTQQLRLRNLIQVLAFNISSDRPERRESYSYTLHSTIMSAPFYTSERHDVDCPKWKELDNSEWRHTECGAAEALVIRLWSHDLNDNSDNMISVWGVHLNGLTYLGEHLGVDTPILKNNALIFKMVGGYFTDPCCIESEPKIRFVSVQIAPSDIHQSYTVNLLLRLRTLQQAIRKQSTAAEIMKQKISMGDFFSNETREKSALRRLLNRSKPKMNHQELLKIRERIELHKFRVQLLKDEKSIMIIRLQALRQRINSLSDRNVMMESSIMEHYRLLRREVQSHREWRRGHVERREAQLHSRAMLNFRTKQLISELDLIYPIEEKQVDKYTICGVHLPDSEDFLGHDDVQIAVALGFVSHVLHMISIFLQVPLRYPIIHLGSRSRVMDHISEKIPESEREFPLYSRGKDKLQFNYAVYLLNKNIAQLRWLCGLPTQDLRNTLANLSSLVKMKSSAACDVAFQTRSLSSSTADLCGSTLSISSPVGSVFSLVPKKTQRPYRVSESDTLLHVQQTAPQMRLHSAPTHRVSKSVGSAKEFMLITNMTENNVSSSVDGAEPLQAVKPLPLGRSLSLSLDKGLNEYESMAPPSELFQEVIITSADVAVNGESDVITNITTPLTEEKKKEPETDVEWIEDGDVEHVTSSVQEDTNEEQLVQAEVNCDVQESKLFKDEVLEKVTSRAEVLANQTTTFNRFRLSKLKSSADV